MFYPGRFNKKIPMSRAAIIVTLMLGFQLLVGQRASYAVQHFFLPNGGMVIGTVTYTDDTSLAYPHGTGHSANGSEYEDHDSIDVNVSAEYFGLAGERKEYSDVYTTATETFELLIPDGMNLFSATMTFGVSGAAFSITPGAAPSAMSCVTGEVTGSTGAFAPPETSYGPPGVALEISHQFENKRFDKYTFTSPVCTANALCPDIVQNPVPLLEGVAPIPEETAQATVQAWVNAS